MLRNRKSRLLAAGIVTGLLATLAPVGAAHAATEPSYPSTSAAPVYLVDGIDNIQYAAGTELPWNAPLNAHIAPIPVPTTPEDYETVRMPYAATAEQAITFISTPGGESARSNWQAYGDLVALNGQGVLLPNVNPSAQINGLPGQAAVKAAGGTYSLGVAYVKNNGLTVVSAYFTTINVDAGTGTWKFATPAPACNTVNTDIATTTTLAADKTEAEQGQSTVLTATVSASKAVTGNVEFYSGTTKIGTTALSGGTTSHTATVGVVGANTFSAKYVESVVETGACPAKTTDTFKASTSADVTITGILPAVAMPPMAPSDNALNANTAHGATASYNATTHAATLTVDAANNGTTFHTFVYSTATYLGDFAVAGGTITADVSMLDAGDHKMAITNTAGDVVAWAMFTKTDAAIDPSFTKQINADVANAQTPADGEFSLTNLSGSTVNLTNPALVNGQSVVSGELGNFKVTDLRQVSKPGWNLSTTVADFTKGTDTIGKSALGIAPKVVSQAGTGATAPTMGAAQVSGAAAYPWDFAELAASAYSGVSTYNADLVFTAPAGKPAGTYSSTLTLTLISK